MTSIVLNQRNLLSDKSRALIFSCLSFCLVQLSFDYFRLVIMRWASGDISAFMPWLNMAKIGSASFFLGIVVAALTVDRVRRATVLPYAMAVYGILCMISSWHHLPMIAQLMVIIGLCFSASYLSLLMTKTMLDLSNKTLRLFLVPLFLTSFTVWIIFSRLILNHSHDWPLVSLVLGLLCILSSFSAGNLERVKLKSIAGFEPLIAMLKNSLPWFILSLVALSGILFYCSYYIELVLIARGGGSHDYYYWLMGLFLALALGGFTFSYLNYSWSSMRPVLVCIMTFNIALITLILMHILSPSLITKQMPLLVFLNMSLIYCLFQGEYFFLSRGSGFLISLILALFYLLGVYFHSLQQLFSHFFEIYSTNSLHSELYRGVYSSVLLIALIALVVVNLPVVRLTKYAHKRRLMVYFRRAWRRQMPLAQVFWGLHCLGAFIVSMFVLLFASLLTLFSPWLFLAALVIGGLLVCFYQFITSILLLKCLKNTRHTVWKVIVAPIAVIGLYQFVPLAFFMLDIMSRPLG